MDTIDFDNTNVGDKLVIIGHSYSATRPAHVEVVERKTKTLLITDRGTRINRNGWEPGKSEPGWSPAHALPYNEESLARVTEYARYCEHSHLASRLIQIRWGRCTLDTLRAATAALTDLGILQGGDNAQG